MILKNAIKIMTCLIFMLLFNNILSQEIKKENLYIFFNKNNGSFDDSLGKKFLNEKGVNFNLYKYYFTNYKNLRIDTLCSNKLEKLQLTDENNIEKKAHIWRKKNEKKLKNKYGILYRQSTENKNNIFNTFIIEKINSNQIVLYEVKFRNEEVVK